MHQWKSLILSEKPKKLREVADHTKEIISMIGGWWWGVVGGGVRVCLGHRQTPFRTNPGDIRSQKDTTEAQIEREKPVSERDK